MKEIIAEILKKDLGEQYVSISEIVGFGTVNNVYDVTCQTKQYIIRINADKHKQLEFLKETWCISKARESGIFVPKILGNGMIDGYPYMIQEKIEGVNGSTCSKKDKIRVWKFLGECALKYNEIKDIDIPALKAAEFHENWSKKLEYNINQLNAKDTLLLNNVFSLEEHNQIKKVLISMKDKEYKVGLIHGDLSPRNVIVNGSSMYLLDWGTAAIDIVPYNEIGIIQIEGEADKEEFNSFLNGMGIDEKKYSKIETTIKKSNILHRLDKYRWATSYDVENLKNYTDKLRQVYEKIKPKK